MFLFLVPIVSLVSVGEYEGQTCKLQGQGLELKCASGGFVSESTYLVVYQSLGCHLMGLGVTYVPSLSGLGMGCTVPVLSSSGLGPGPGLPVPPLNESAVYY